MGNWWRLVAVGGGWKGTASESLGRMFGRDVCPATRRPSPQVLNNEMVRNSPAFQALTAAFHDPIQFATLPNAVPGSGSPSGGKRGLALADTTPEFSEKFPRFVRDRVLPALQTRPPVLAIGGAAEDGGRSALLGVLCLVRVCGGCCGAAWCCRALAHSSGPPCPVLVSFSFCSRKCVPETVPQLGHGVVATVTDTGGGGSRGQQKGCLPEVDLQFPAHLINFIFL